MLESILSSRVKTLIVKFFAGSADAYQVSDIAKRLGISKSRASECLRELERQGALESRYIGRSRLYKAAPTELAEAIFSSVREDRLLAMIEEEVLHKTRKFRPASLVLFGSALRGLKIGSDVDFLLLCKTRPEEGELYKMVASLSERFGFHISILPMHIADFRSKARKGDELVMNILAEGKLVYGEELEKVLWQGK